jgi:hypothetical protein
MSESKDIASVEEVVGQLKPHCCRMKPTRLVRAKLLIVPALGVGEGCGAVLAGGCVTIEQRQIACGE